MAHDSLFQKVLQRVSREFLALFFPHVAARLDFGRVALLDEALLTALPEGDLTCRKINNGR